MKPTMTIRKALADKKLLGKCSRAQAGYAGACC